MLKGGKIILTDLAADMLIIAQENASERCFHNIETHVCEVCELPFADKLNSKTAAAYWGMQTVGGAPIVAALNKADAAMKEKIKNEFYEKLNDSYHDRNVIIDSSVLIIYGEK